MRGFLLDPASSAQVAAAFRAVQRAALVRPVPASHGCARSMTASNVSTRSENRYPSPLARSALPPCGPRHSSLQGAPRWPGSADGRRVAVICAISVYARAGEHVTLSGVITRSRAEPCVNPSSSLPPCPRPSSPAACKPTVSVPSRAPLPARWLRTRPTTTRSPARPSARLRAPIATTQASAADHPIRRLTCATARGDAFATRGSPDRSVRGAFFVTAIQEPAPGPATGAAARSIPI